MPIKVLDEELVSKIAAGKEDFSEKLTASIACHGAVRACQRVL